MKLALLIAGGTTALAAVAGLLPAPAPQATDKTPWVLTAKPERKTLPRILVLPGEVRAFEEVVLYSRAPGYLETIDVDRGATVSKGDILATVAVPEVRKKLAREEANLALSPAHLARDQAAVRWRDTIWNRLNETMEKAPHLVNRDTLDDARGRSTTARAELKVTEAREAGLKATVETTKEWVGFATIQAPFDGIVTERWVDPGDLILPATSMIVRVTRVDPVRIRIRVPETDVHSIRVGGPAIVSIEELPGKHVEASISRIFWALHPRSKAMRVELDVKNPGGAIRPGMSATVSLRLEDRQNALVVPAAALITESESVEVVEKAIDRKLPGELLPFQQIGIHARVEGFLESIAVDRGDRVKKGQVLAVIDVPELQRGKERHEAELALCPPTLARDQAVLDWRESAWKRLQGIAEKTPNLVTKDELDQARGRYDTARAEVELTGGREASLRAAVEETQALIDLATIRAPFDGVITERWVDPGALIQPGKTKLLHLMQADRFRVRVHLAQDDVPFIKVASNASIEFPFATVPGEPFKRPVSRLFWGLNRNTKTMAAEIDLPNTQEALRPGMYAEVTLPLERQDPGEDRVRHEERTVYYVLVVEGDRVGKKRITIGQDNGIEIEVLEGIDDQTRVVVRGKNIVSEGERVHAK